VTRALELRRVLPAPVDVVFDAWTTGELLAAWFVCDPSWTARVEIDCRVGGAYRIEMFDDGRSVGLARGEYVALEPPHRLAFTWTSEGPVGVSASLVTVELRPHPTGCELILVHDLDPETPAGRAHERGWRGCLDCLHHTLEEKTR